MTASAFPSSTTSRTTKKRAPSAARRATSLRLAPLTARDVEVDVGIGSVRDPYDANSFIRATVNRRVDVLATERTAKPARISEAEFQVGRMIQAVYERGSGARLGSAGWGEGGSRDQTVAHELQIMYALDDAEKVRKFTDAMARAVGGSGVRVLRAILAEGKTFQAYATSIGWSGERAATDVAKRFRWLLTEVTATLYTARAPGPAPIKDRYASGAEAVDERLARSAALRGSASAD